MPVSPTVITGPSFLLKPSVVAGFCQAHLAVWKLPGMIGRASENALCIVHLFLLQTPLVWNWPLLLRVHPGPKVSLSRLISVWVYSAAFVFGHGELVLSHLDKDNRVPDNDFGFLTPCMCLLKKTIKHQLYVVKCVRYWVYSCLSNRPDSSLH